MYKSVRRDRFKRLWPKRLQKAIWHIESIGKLSEKTNYIYKPEEVKAIKSQLNKTLAIKYGVMQYPAIVFEDLSSGKQQPVYEKAFNPFSEQDMSSNN